MAQAYSTPGNSSNDFYTPQASGTRRAQAYSTPGNSANNFYTPQASGTRRTQANPASSYFGTGGQTGYSQSAWSGGNNGNPSGIGAGGAGIGAGDGPGAGSAGLNANGGPGSFTQAMNGQGGVPGSGGNFQWGSVTAGPWGTDYSDPATAQQYSSSMEATGDLYETLYGSSAPTPMNNAGQAAAATAGTAGGTPGYDPSGGAGLQQGSSPRRLSVTGGAYVESGNGSIPMTPELWNQYLANYLANAPQYVWGNDGWPVRVPQNDINAGYRPPLGRLVEFSNSDGSAYRPSAARLGRLVEFSNSDGSAYRPSAGRPADAGGPQGNSPVTAGTGSGMAMATSGMLPPEYQGQSQLGAAMQSGMPTQAIGQQMGAPGAVDPYSTALPESFAQGGYQPGDTSIPTGNIGGAPPNAVSPERFGRLPVNELQRIASGQGSQLRPELQQQAAMMASNELARRGAGGNNLAAGNQQAQDPRAVEQSTGFQQAERIRQLQQMGPEDAVRGNTPQQQQRLEASGVGQFLQGLGQGLGWMNPNNIPGFGSSPSTPPPEVAMDPEALFRDSLAQVRQQYGPIDIFGEDGSTGAYGLENAIAGGYGSGAGMNLPPGMGGWNTTGAPDVPGVGTGQMPGSIGGDVPMRPLAPQGPGGVPQNPYEKNPGYVQPQSRPQSPTSTGNPIWGSQPQPSANPYPGTTQLMPFGQGLPPGISGSMAIGPDGKPYGGTPNLSRPEPNPGTIPGNDFPGYGNDVVERPKSPSQLARERAEEAMRGSQRTAQANQDPNSIFYNHGPNSKLLAAVLGNPNYN